MAPSTDAVRSVFKLVDLVHDTLDQTRELINGKAVHVAVDIDRTLVFDSYPKYLRDVLIHLIDNAVVHGFHGPRHGTIWIRARPERNDGVRIEVEDNGQGIAEKDLPRVFEPFFTTRMAKGSSGLGLHMVHNRVTGLLGGSLHIESEPDQYTRVYIHLPKTNF